MAMMFPRSAQESSLALTERQKLISRYPLFCLLAENDIRDLALIAQEISIAPGEIIVNEGDLVTCFYLIKSGTAKVTKTLLTLAKKEIMQIAILQEGDAIGLMESGFFSSTGIRSATVTAQTPMELMVVQLQAFNEFLNKPGLLYPALKNIGKKILLMQILKDTKLFQHVRNEKIRQLAQHFNSMVIHTGELIFNEGDAADACYILLSGEINLVTHRQKSRVTTLTAPVFFGEDALLENTKRHASAIAKTACELVKITRNNVYLVIKANQAFNDALLNYCIEQTRPLAKSDVLVQKEMNEEMTLLRQADRKIPLSKKEYALWRTFDGQTALSEVKNKFIGLSLYDAYHFALKMHQAGFVDLNCHVPLQSTSFFRKATSSLINKIRVLWK